MYFGFQFAKAAKTLPGYAVRHYVDTLATDPEALHASFAIYRALDATIAQNEERRTRRLTCRCWPLAAPKASAKAQRTQ